LPGSSLFVTSSNLGVDAQSICSGSSIFKGLLKAGPKECSCWHSNGMVDPKTFLKWVWAFVDALAELVGIVVSIFSPKITHNVRVPWSGCNFGMKMWMA
jgi:hypothetical protein